MQSWTPFLEGFFLQLSLILALGAQNVFVIESGVKRQNHWLVAFVCSLCDLSLIFIGILGTSSLFKLVPALRWWIGVAGVIFLLYYGFLKAYEVFVPPEHSEMEEHPEIPRKKTVMTALAFSLLNPHVYLDTIVLVGGYASKLPIVSERLIFGCGAGTFSTLWFFALALSSSLFRDLLNSKKGMQAFALFSSLVMFFLSYKLGIEVF